MSISSQLGKEEWGAPVRPCSQGPGPRRCPPSLQAPEQGRAPSRSELSLPGQETQQRSRDEHRLSRGHSQALTPQ